MILRCMSIVTTAELLAFNASAIKEFLEYDFRSELNASCTSGSSIGLFILLILSTSARKYLLSILITRIQNF